MKKLLFYWILSVAFLQAQAENNAQAPNKMGEFLAQTGELGELARTPKKPLRIGILPWSYHGSKAEITLPHARLKEIHSPYFEAQVLNENIPLPKAKLLDALSLAHNIDIFVHGSIIKTEKNHWLILRIVSAVDGHILQVTQKQSEVLSEDLWLDWVKETLLKYDWSAIKNIHDYSEEGHSEIHLRTSPDHLKAYLNGKNIGYTPLFVRSVPEGDHILKLEEQEPVQIDRIIIKSEPSNIEVLWNKTSIGKTPLNVPELYLNPGEHDIEFLSPQRISAEIGISSQPKGLKVQLQDKSIKRTPITFQRLNKKHYRLKLFEYTPNQASIPIQLGDKETISKYYSLYKRTEVFIDSQHPKTEIWDGNEKIGETPLVIKLSQGVHQLEARRKHYRNHPIPLNLLGGEKKDLNIHLIPKSTDTSFFLTPSAYILPGLNVHSKWMGLGTLKQTTPEEITEHPANTLGLEIGYGLPERLKLSSWLDLGFSVGAYFNLLMADFTPQATYQGIGGKIQLLQEDDKIPLSIALGSYLNLDLQNPKWVGYLSLSRYFGDFALHLGLQTHGFNLSSSYTGWDNLYISASLFNNTIFKFLDLELDNKKFEIDNLLGIQVGYNF